MFLFIIVEDEVVGDEVVGDLVVGDLVVGDLVVGDEVVEDLVVGDDVVEAVRIVVVIDIRLALLVGIPINVVRKILAITSAGLQERMNEYEKATEKQKIRIDSCMRYV